MRHDAQTTHAVRMTADQLAELTNKLKVWQADRRARELQKKALQLQELERAQKRCVVLRARDARLTA